jgi:hypothetical protein
MSTSPAVESARLKYDTDLRFRVRSYLEQGPSNLIDFLAALEGADPMTALDVLEQFKENSLVARELLDEALMPLPRFPAALPIGHPLDYPWLFDIRTRHSVLQRIASFTVPGDLIVYLGCPTLHEVALEALPEREHLLLDRDVRRVDRANGIKPGSASTVDLSGAPVAVTGARLTIADPPWYEASTKAFLGAAREVTVGGGAVLFSFAGALTRPGIGAEVSAILDEASREGLALAEVETGACRYDMPAFEQAAFAAAGRPGIPAGWRRGDLYRFEVVGRRTTRPRRARGDLMMDDWKAVEIDSVPLRVRSTAPPTGGSLISSLVDGDILPTVSRRDPRRDRVALWSPCNRVFASNDPATLEQLVLELIRNGTAAGANPAFEGLRTLVRLERFELGLEESDRWH